MTEPNHVAERNLKKRIRFLAYGNAIGFPLITLVLGIAFIAKPFAWGDVLLLLLMLLSIPFTFCGILTLRNLRQPEEKRIRNLFAWVMVVFLIPFTALPFAFEAGGLLIFLLLLAVALVGNYLVKSPLRKLELANYLGLFFLIFCGMMVLGTLSDL